MSTKIDLTKNQVDHVIGLYSSGSIQEAIEEINSLNILYPNVPLLFNILGACYKQLGQLSDAEKMFKNAFSIKPDYAEAHFNYGIVQKDLGRIGAAIESYQNAISILPNYPDAHNNLGNAFKSIGMYAHAIESYEWAVAYKPEFEEAFNNLGVAQCDVGLQHLAIKNFEKAYSLNSNFIKALFYLGVAHKDLGNKAVAISTFEKLLKIQSYNTKVLRNLCEVKKFKKSDSNLINKMESLLNSDKVNQSELIDLNFALSNVYEDLGDIDTQFKYLADGNKLRKALLSYSIESSIKLFNTIKDVFDDFPTLANNELSQSSLRPIFIVGMPRSGTSLVEQIVASHNEAHGAGELEFSTQIFSSIIANISVEVDKKDLLFFREQYLAKLNALKCSKNIITDKMPMNFRYIGLILSAFPEAKIIHLKRDARATCWSIYKNYFDSDGIGYSYDQNDLAQYYGLYSDLMSFWHERFPDQIYDICYEDLTTNQEEETRKLLEYCDLDWDENCLNFHSNKRAVKTASALQVRKKMYQGSSEAWKKYEAYLQPLIKGLDSY
ncbi:sulfotransferase [Candidatus Pseudothioglobus singularis]|nr:sulfotransferase [Candidatus Pseudothioglobus singularis]